MHYKGYGSICFRGKNLDMVNGFMTTALRYVHKKLWITLLCTDVWISKSGCKHDSCSKKAINLAANIGHNNAVKWHRSNACTHITMKRLLTTTSARDSSLPHFRISTVPQDPFESRV